MMQTKAHLFKVPMLRISVLHNAVGQNARTHFDATNSLEAQTVCSVGIIWFYRYNR